MCEDTTYICKFCGIRSHSEQKIKDCESKGGAHRYQIKQKVTFLKGLLEVEGSIATISFAIATHKTFYGLTVEGKLGITIAEENIVRVVDPVSIKTA